jgi:hypothetical protein
MCQVPLDLGHARFPVDVCRNCQFFWFDADEFETLPPPEPPKLAPAAPSRESDATPGIAEPAPAPESIRGRLLAGSGIGIAGLVAALADFFNPNPDRD